MKIKFERYAEHVKDYDIIVAGGGVAGVAAAVSAKRMGKNVLLIEKTIGLGGLATTGLIDLFVPMCNGRGIQIIKGMAEELLRLSIKYGYDTIPEPWKNGEPGGGETTRYITRFSAPIFTLSLTELLKEEGVDILFDTIIVQPVMEDKFCKGLVVENKSGCSYYGAKMVVDTTGDADVLVGAGVPTVKGKNYHTYLTKGANIESCKNVVESGNISKLYDYKYNGGTVSLYGKEQPEGKPPRIGISAKEVNEYVIENHLECIENLKKSDRMERTIVSLPSMPQFRETRRIDGEYALKETDTYRHFEDSVGAICDFDRRDYLYEIPYRTMIRKEFPNLITAGRSAAAEGYAWDVLRVIPPAIITGQAAGIACAMALDDNKIIADVDIKKLQSELEKENVMIHFDDSLVPSEERADSSGHVEGHL
ncbi:MAG: FAD-dependent oxidoreductase [Clostridia bacterium]|nr:FAD-dependent oxidoreductase [Clostridia bacterium]